MFISEAAFPMKFAVEVIAVSRPRKQQISIEATLYHDGVSRSLLFFNAGPYFSHCQ